MESLSESDTFENDHDNDHDKDNDYDNDDNEYARDFGEGTSLNGCGANEFWVGGGSGRGHDIVSDLEEEPVMMDALALEDSVPTTPIMATTDAGAGAGGSGAGGGLLRMIDSSLVTLRKEDRM